ncbi:uncharacterized protein LOC123559985 isoform X2 [Mercenaria mercenaria]|uniref:uncharacterized protein LOC123559985 isoform X2 n=1 Tax=Mercenaria mercenaria TaxID=6596 RepID=UPI00234E6F21|nr:uncharacterized protein LOC123559985 isoform X2 [Mercenaria mercenaria]
MEGAEVITILTNKQLILRHKSKVTNLYERRACYSPGMCFEEESAFRPEPVHKDMKKIRTVYEDDNTTEKSSTYFELDTDKKLEHVGADHSDKIEIHKTKSYTYSNSDSEIKVKAKATRNKNKTLRLAKRACDNTWKNSLIDLSEGQNNKRNYVPGNEEQKLPNCDVERDENRNYLQSNKDFIVHSSDDDYDTAMVFRNDLLKLDIPDLTFDNFVHINPQKTEMESISSLHEQCNTVLLFVTHNYANDKLRRRQAEILLHQSLEMEGLEHWVVPVWVEKGAKKSILEWAPIKGIQYYQSQQNKSDFSKQVSDLVMTGRRRPMYQGL